MELMVKKIVKDPLFLEQKSVDATEVDKQVVTDLLDTLRANLDHCVGMAANMIGVKKNIIVVAAGPFQFAMINPVITKKSGAYQTEEGCLSLEGHTSAASFQERLAALFVSTKGASAHEVQTTDSTAIEVFLHERSKRYTITENRSSSGSSALATSIETAPKTTAFSAACRTSRTIYGKRAAFPAGKHKPARAKKTAGDSECQKENGRKPEESKEAPRPATCRTAVAGNDRKARQSSGSGRNDKSRPEGSLPMPQTPPAKDQRIAQGMSEQPQIGTSRPVAPVHAPGERHVGAPPFGKNPFIKLIGRESFRLPHLARTHRHGGQRQAAVPFALEQHDIPVPAVIVRPDRFVFPEHAVTDIIGIAAGYADAEIDIVQMKVPKELLVERMFAPDRLGHDQALAVHLNDRREVDLSGPALQADHTLADMLVETGPFIATQSPH